MLSKSKPDHLYLTPKDLITCKSYLLDQGYKPTELGSFLKETYCRRNSLAFRAWLIPNMIHGSDHIVGLICKIFVPIQYQISVLKHVNEWTISMCDNLFLLDNTYLKGLDVDYNTCYNFEVAEYYNVFIFSLYPSDIESFHKLIKVVNRYANLFKLIDPKMISSKKRGARL